jgi:nicotinate-nucleotide adenylyltransferase
VIAPGERPVSAIGVMGGTFDPIHVGHLAVGEEAREALSLDVVLFVPAAQPPHKPVGSVTSVAHRVAMVELAIADNSSFELSTLEIERAGPSYTVDTVEDLARRHPGSELFVILSAETVAQLPTWHEPERLFAVARIAVVPREGYPAPDPAWLTEAFPGHEDRVTYLAGPRLGISSTAIRERVASARSVRYLVPDEIAAYIEEHDLYRTGWRHTSQ